MRAVIGLAGVRVCAGQYGRDIVGWLRLEGGHISWSGGRVVVDTSGLIVYICIHRFIHSRLLYESLTRHHLTTAMCSQSYLPPMPHHSTIA